MDALSDVLRAVRLTGAVFLEAELRSGWSYLTPPPEAIGALHMPGAELIIPYHLVSEGRCHASLPGGEPVELQSGELIIFPHGDRHVLASQPQRQQVARPIAQELHVDKRHHFSP